MLPSTIETWFLLFFIYYLVFFFLNIFFTFTISQSIFVAFFLSLLMPILWLILYSLVKIVESNPGSSSKFNPFWAEIDESIKALFSHDELLWPICLLTLLFLILFQFKFNLNGLLSTKRKEDIFLKKVYLTSLYNSIEELRAQFLLFNKNDITNNYFQIKKNFAFKKELLNFNTTSSLITKLNFLFSRNVFDISQIIWFYIDFLPHNTQEYMQLLLVSTIIFFIFLEHYSIKIAFSLSLMVLFLLQFCIAFYYVINKFNLYIAYAKPEMPQGIFLDVMLDLLKKFLYQNLVLFILFVILLSIMIFFLIYFCNDNKLEIPYTDIQSSNTDLLNQLSLIYIKADAFSNKELLELISKINFFREDLIIQNTGKTQKPSWTLENSINSILTWFWDKLK